MRKHLGRKIAAGAAVAALGAAGLGLALASSSVQLPFSGTYNGQVSTTTAVATSVIATGFDGSDPACTWSESGGNISLTVSAVPFGGAVMCRTSVTYNNTGQAALDLQGFTVTTPTAGVVVTPNVEPGSSASGCGYMVPGGATSIGVPIEVSISGVARDTTGTLTGSVNLATTGSYSAAACDGASTQF